MQSRNTENRIHPISIEPELQMRSIDKSPPKLPSQRVSQGDINMVAGYINTMTERLSIPKGNSNSSPQRQVNRYLRTLKRQEEKFSDRRATLQPNSNVFACSSNRIEKLQPIISPARVRPIDVSHNRNVPITAALKTRSILKTQDSLF